MEFITTPSKQLLGEITIPGDKSISHRSIMLGSLAEGKTEVRGFLQGADCLATIDAFKAMGVTIQEKQDHTIVIQGVGLQGLKPPHGIIDLGNSGTSIRLLSGILAGQTFSTTLTGDASLCSRPMLRVVQPLQQMGAEIETAKEGRPPLKIQGGKKLKGISYTLPIASAQVKSCLLLAGLYAEGKTTVIETGVSRDHTERMLKGFGVSLENEGNSVSIQSGQKLFGTVIDVPGDISSAAFFLVAASIVPNSRILLKHVGVNPTRIGCITILKQMGAKIECRNLREVCGEPVADIYVESAKLQGITIPVDQVPLAIDEFPVLFIAAACATGTTILRGAKELRVKESDRIHSMALGLQTLGIHCEECEDGIRIEGGKFLGGVVDSFHDHRIAMAFTIAGMVASAPITVCDTDNVKTSFPNFADLLIELGGKIKTVSRVMKNLAPVITIDGPSGSGKGTISFLLAKKLGWYFLDSGAIYRVLAYAALQAGINADGIHELTQLAEKLPLAFQTHPNTMLMQIFYGREEVTEKIRDEKVGIMASKIAVHAEVRSALLQRQRDFQKAPGLVTDGRDMGTVVFPHANYKFFLSAKLEERACRRLKQIEQMSETASYEAVLADLTSRDARDKSRAVAPLKPAEDAIIIDTTGLTIEQVLQQVLAEIEL